MMKLRDSIYSFSKDRSCERPFDMTWKDPYTNPKDIKWNSKTDHKNPDPINVDIKKLVRDYVILPEDHAFVDDYLKNVYYRSQHLIEMRMTCSCSFFKRKLCNNYRLSFDFWTVKIFTACAHIIEKLITFISFIVWPRLSCEFCIKSLEVWNFAHIDIEMIRFHSMLTELSH